MRVALQLPTHRVFDVAEFVSGVAVTEIARAAEVAGFDAVFVTDHPIPDVRWVAEGGHHALDPFVALSHVAACTERLRVMTNICVAPYRNPFLLAKSAASLDVLSGGRLILGIGTGYLEGEFAALGVDLQSRNEATDDAIRVVRETWTGDTVVHEGPGYSAAGNVALPMPVQRPGPPIWVGGNSRRAIRRAVELGDGWMPFLNPTGSTARTASLDGVDALAEGIATAREHAERCGRTEPLEIAFMPSWREAMRMEDGDAIVHSAEELTRLGVTYLLTAVPSATRAELLDRVAWSGETVLPRLAAL